MSTEAYAKLVELAKVARELAALAHRCHYDGGEDCWYACPRSETGCCDDSVPQDVCNCGADAHNEKVVALAARIEAIMHHRSVDVEAQTV